ncbi:MAG: lytic transglycosylase domain-containing protein [Lachnospiraceae bacterium]|nr:lytic transglycosylase domain-containing protein [Lachnospiraceae bacterium]
MDVQAINATAKTVAARGTSSTQSTEGKDFSGYLKEAKSSTTSLDAIFEKAADKYNVDVNLLKAMAKAESGFNPKATSHCGAMGVMQLMPATAKSLGVKDAYDPEQNIMGGAKYISRLLKNYNGNTTLALAAYNAGSGNVKKYGGVPPFKETQNYIKRIKGYMNDGVSIPDKYNSVTVASGNDYSNYENSSNKSSDTTSSSSKVDPDDSQILSLSDSQERQLSSLLGTTNKTQLLDTLSELLSKLRNEDENEETYDDYARFMKVYLDGIAVSNLSLDKEQQEDLQQRLSDVLKDFKESENLSKEIASTSDIMVASQSINYNKTVLNLLTEDTTK